MYYKIHFVRLLLVPLVVLSSEMAADAASLYSRAARASGSGFNDYGGLEGTSTWRASAGYSDSNITRTAEGIARSELGYVSGYARASLLSNGGPISGTANASADTFFQINDLVITKLPGYSELPEMVDITAQITFLADSSFGDFDITGNISAGTPFGSPTNGSSTIFSQSQLGVDQPFTLVFAVDFSKNLNGTPGTAIGRYTASLDAVEAFVVPEGYVVNSIDANVVDNVYLGPINPVTGGIDGDYNFDGLVDAADYTVWRDAFETGNALPNDTTPSSVTIDDYDVWVAHYGSPIPCTTTGTSIPEPSALLLVISFSILKGLGSRPH